MGTFKGKRIIPKHDGVWNQKKEYEELTIVLDAESGDGYISRKPVPAGTVLSDTDYWSLCSHFNAQMHRLETDVAEDVEGMHRNLSETKASMSKEVSEAESRVNTKVSDAQSAMQKTEDAMNTAVEQMNKRLDANVTASTDAKADYAAELVDVRVGQDGTVYPSAGEAIRGQYSQAVENGITGAKLALAGSNGNLGEVFPKAAMPALLGAKCEAGEFLDYRITGTTDYGQFYHRFTNMLMGKFRKYLFISKIREISGSCAGVSCYQYDSKGANLNTHVTKVVRVAHGNEIYVVFFGEILENAYRLDISPCVARNDAVVECDGRCVLLDVTGQSDDELQKVLSLISSSPVEDSILQYYDTWGIAGKVMSVPYADRTGISDQTREMLGNVAYGCPVFSEMIPFSSKFQEKDTMYAWAKAAVTRNEDWGVFGGVRLSGLAAGKYLVFGRVESVETDDTQLGEVSIGIIEPGIPNWAKRVPCGTLNKATLPFQMNLVYEYAGGKDNLNFAVQLTGSNTMVKGSSFILDFLCISWHSQYQSFSFYQESVVYDGILFEHFLQKFFHDLGFPLYPFIFPAFLFRCLFILQCLIFRSCPIMYFLEILRKKEEHIVEIIFQFFAPVQIIKPVLSAILQTFFSDIRSFFTLHIGISPTLSALSHAIISTFAFNISADLMDGRFPVLLPDQRCVASEKFIEPFQFFRF